MADRRWWSKTNFNREAEAEKKSAGTVTAQRYACIFEPTLPLVAPVLEQDSDGSDDEHGAPIIMQQLYGPNAPGNNYPLFLSLVAQICHAFPAPLESKLPSPVPSADTYIGNRCLVPYHLMRLRANGSQPRLINSAKALRQAAALGQVRTSALRFLARASLRPTLVSKEVKPVSELSPAELKLALSLQGVKPLGNTKATKVARLKLAVSDAPIIRNHLNQLLYREGALQLQKCVHSFVFRQRVPAYQKPYFSACSKASN